MVVVCVIIAVLFITQRPYEFDPHAQLALAAPTSTFYLFSAGETTFACSLNGGCALMNFLQNHFTVETLWLALNTNSIAFSEETMALERFFCAVPTFPHVASNRYEMPRIARI